MESCWKQLIWIIVSTESLFLNYAWKYSNKILLIKNSYYHPLRCAPVSAPELSLYDNLIYLNNFTLQPCIKFQQKEICNAWLDSGIETDFGLKWPQNVGVAIKDHRRMAEYLHRYYQIKLIKLNINLCGVWCPSLLPSFPLIALTGFITVLCEKWCMLELGTIFNRAEGNK